MASLQPSSVSNIMKALNELKEKIDSLNSKVAVMKKNLNQKANSGIDKIIEKQEKWHKRGWRKDCRTSIKNNASFDNAVKHIVSTVLKA